MNKTISMTIGGQIFHIEEPAYQNLEQYLLGLKQHFSGYTDKEEILADIENRMAELFSQHRPAGQAALNAEDVERVMATMGKPEQFEDEDHTQQTTKAAPAPEPTAKTSKRLYRNTDDRVIAGVCSGIAAYINVEPVILRAIVLAIFLISLFTQSGAALFIGIVYVCLYLIIPEAKTISQKVEMQGEPMTVSNIAEQAKSEEEKNQSKRSVLERGQQAVGSVFAAVFQFIGRVFRVLFSIIRVVFALFLMVFFGLAVAGLLFVAAVLLFNIQSPYVDTTIRSLAIGPLYYAGVIALFFAFAVPAFSLFLVGFSVLRRQRVFTVSLISTLIGVWVLSGIASGVILIDRIPYVEEALQKQEDVVTQTVTYPLSSFSRVATDGDYRITFVASSTPSVVATGDQKTLDRLLIQVEDDTLTITGGKRREFCLFCRTQPLRLEIASNQALDRLQLSGVSRATLKNMMSTSSIELVLNDVSSLAFEGSASSVSAMLSDVSRLSMRGASEHFTLEAHSNGTFDGSAFTTNYLQATMSDVSRAELNMLAASSTNEQPQASIRLRDTASLTLDGESSSLEANLRDVARLRALGLETSTSTVGLQDASRAELHVTDSLKAFTRDASRVRYVGEPRLKDVQDLNASRVEQEEDPMDQTFDE